MIGYFDRWCFVACIKAAIVAVLHVYMIILFDYFSQGIWFISTLWQTMSLIHKTTKSCFLNFWQLFKLNINEVSFCAYYLLLHVLLNLVLEFCNQHIFRILFLFGIYVFALFKCFYRSRRQTIVMLETRSQQNTQQTSDPRQTVTALRLELHQWLIFETIHD